MKEMDCVEVIIEKNIPKKEYTKGCRGGSVIRV